MASERSTNPLQGLLDEAESDLTRRLHEACEAEAKGAVSGSAAEIRQLEDTLLSAALAAERTIAARRHLEVSSPGEQESATRSTRERADMAAPSDVSLGGAARGEKPAPSSTAVREFEDETGRAWRAWPVTPAITQTQGASRRSLGDFQEGWICFEALDNSGRRRLPRRGRRWSDLSAEDLPRLLQEAINVPVRARTPHDSLNQPEGRKLN